ncbi:MAG: M56 family peptidase, partial [Mycobacterium sp.]|nr:M56 family peptidase [Mycobacterium sp.]
MGVAVISPAVLHSMVRRGVAASRVLVIWAALVSGAIILIALPALGEVVHRCWLVLHNGQPTRFDATVALLSAA